MKKMLFLFLFSLSSVVAFAQDASIPIGTVVAWAGNRATLPKGWLVCDGSQISKDNYPKLCAVLGNYWGPTDTDPSVARLFYFLTYEECS